jgi:LacI family transcriptional regulator
MKKHISVGVFLPFALAFGRSVLRGVQVYAQRKPEWQLVVSDTAQPPPGEGFVECMIGSVGSDPWIRTALSCRAAVNVSNRVLVSPVPRVVSDDVEVGRMAAKHLIDQGFRRFGFVDWAEYQFGRERCQGFSEALSAAGYKCEVFDSKTGVGAGIAGLEKPVGVFTATDTLARLHIEKLVREGVHVPEEVAVIGVDNDELESQISPVAITSVVPDGEKIGYEAARLLDALLSGRKPPQRPVRVAPLYVVGRRSTDCFAASHPAVARALQVMRAQSTTLATVDDVAAAVGIGRRTLERLFREEIGQSIYKELCRAKLNAVMPEILRGGTPMFQIAAQAGFTDARLFNNVCRRILGKTPGQIRKEAQFDR